jgi:hypothetical protein
MVEVTSRLIDLARLIRHLVHALQSSPPWAELAAVVEPFYPKVSEAGGRPPLPLERMLRVYFLQLWLNLSDPAVEEELYDSASMRNFAGIDLGGRSGARRDDGVQVSPSAGEEQTGEEAADNRERSPEAQRHQDHDRDDRRCDDYRGAKFDEE